MKITVNTLSAELQQLLNGANNANMIAAGLDASSTPPIIRNTSFRFRIFSEMGNLEKPKKSDDNPNVIEIPINAVMQVISSTVDAFSVSLGTSVEFLVPVMTQDGFGDYDVYNAVRGVLDNVLSTYFSARVSDGEGTYYYESITYKLVDTGERDIRGAFGDSMILRANIDYAFVKEGLPSDSVIFTIDGMEMECLNYSMSRRVTSEPNVVQDERGTDTISYVPIAKNQKQATSLAITATFPVQYTALHKMLMREMADGNAVPHTVTITFPNLYTETVPGTQSIEQPPETETYPYSMLISETINGEFNTNVGMTVEMVESLTAAAGGGSSG